MSIARVRGRELLFLYGEYEPAGFEWRTVPLDGTEHDPELSDSFAPHGSARERLTMNEEYLIVPGEEPEFYAEDATEAPRSHLYRVDDGAYLGQGSQVYALPELEPLPHGCVPVDVRFVGARPVGRRRRGERCDTRRTHVEETTMSTSGILARSLALGLAAGARSTLGPCAPLWARAQGRTPRRGLLALVIAGELVADKMPGIPPRTSGPVLLSRVLGGAWGGALLARNLGGPVLAAVAVAGAAAPVGAAVGVRWRSWWSGSRPPLERAVIEDAVALSLAFCAASGTRRRP